MRRIAVVVLLVGVTASPAQTPGAKRYGIEPDVEAYPQKTPKEALASVLKAIDAGRMDYLMAQLADPQFVDERVKNYAGGFDDLVKETTTKFSQDAASIKEMRRILREGEWQEGDASASAHLKDKERTVFLKKIGDRWFLENRQKGEKGEPSKP